MVSNLIKCWFIDLLGTDMKKNIFLEIVITYNLKKKIRFE